MLVRRKNQKVTAFPQPFHRQARRASMLQVGGENDRKQMLHQMMHLIEATHP